MRRASGGRQEEARERTHLSISTGSVRCLNLKGDCKDYEDYKDDEDYEDRVCAGTDGEASWSLVGPIPLMDLTGYRRGY